jgi:hypothetical protein
MAAPDQLGSGTDNVAIRAPDSNAARTVVTMTATFTTPLVVTRVRDRMGLFANDPA